MVKIGPTRRVGHIWDQNIIVKQFREISEILREIRACDMIASVDSPCFRTYSQYNMVDRFIIFPYIRGYTLREALSANLQIDLTILVELARALEAIHRIKIIHGDLHPGNIVLSDRGPRIIDYAKSGVSGEEYTPQRWLFHPNQEGFRLRPEIDIWAYGVIYLLVIGFINLREFPEGQEAYHVLTLTRLIGNRRMPASVISCFRPDRSWKFPMRVIRKLVEAEKMSTWSQKYGENKENGNQE